MKLSLPHCDLLCFYKQPPEELLSEVRAWLDEDQGRLAIIFDEGALQLHPQITVCGTDRKSITELARKHLFLEFAYLPFGDADAELLSQVEEIVEKEKLIASDFQHCGIDRVHNLLENSRRFSSAYRAKDLFGAFLGIPAIICGAGPSLDGGAPHLGRLKQKALLLAGGTALSSLSVLGVAPHFGAVIDPHPPGERGQLSSAHELPHFFQNRTHFDRLRDVQGPLLWTPGSETDCFEDSTCEWGWNVSTYLATLACHMGCNPIVLIGVDLSAKGGRVYAGGIDCVEAPSTMESSWPFAARFLSEFAASHPEVHWINASDGVDLPHFEKRSLEGIAFGSQYDLEGSIHSAIMTCRPSVMEDFDRGEVLKSLHRLSDLSGQALQILERSCPHLPNQSEEYTLLLFEVEREQAYALYARSVWKVWEPVIARSLGSEVDRAYGIEVNKWIFIKRICDDARHLRS